MRTLMTIALLLFSSAAMAAEKIFDVRIEQRKVVAPGEVIRVQEGDSVTLHWLSDEAVKLHMHGYDLQLDVTANTTAGMYFDAGVTGRFPVTSHGFGPGHGGEHGAEHGHGLEALLYIEVHPE